MSQHDFEIANQGFPSFRSDLNSGLQALASNSAGTTEPTTTYAYQMWYDETTDLLKMRNGDDDAWIALAFFDQTNDEWEVRSAVIQAVDSAGVEIKTDDGTARITVNDNGTVDFANNIDVTGTVTADGLTVDGNNDIQINRDGASAVKLFFDRSGTVDGSLELGADENLTLSVADDGRNGQYIYFNNNTKRVMALADGGDISFYEDTGTTPKLFWDASAERLGVGDTTTNATLHVHGNSVISNGNFFSIQSSSGLSPELDEASNGWAFTTNGSEAMRIDSSGNLLVGTTSPTGVSSGGKFYATPSSGIYAAASGDNAGYFNRNSTDGSIVEFRKDNSVVGSIGSASGGTINFGQGSTYLQFQNGLNAIYASDGTTGRDNAIDLGTSVVRFDDIYATNGTIQTSDRNEKQDIEELSEAEQRVAVAAKGLLRKFRWKSAVEEKGDDARIHFGIIAQDLQAAFEAEGLDAGRYAMFIHSTWTDEETGEERSRMGVRYSELLAFIIAAI